jgi:hypothetical protein
MAADFDRNSRLLVRAESLAVTLQLVETVVRDPLDDEAVRREQAQFVRRFNDLQRPDPRIEILLG